MFNRACTILFLLILLAIMLPILAAVVALFIDSTMLTGGIASSTLTTTHFTISNATQKFSILFLNGDLIHAFFRSIAVAALVGITTSWLALISAYTLTRVELGKWGKLQILGYSAYFTPPVILATSYALLTQEFMSQTSAVFVVAAGQMSYFYPINLGLALGHWKSVPFEVDRVIAADGASFYGRLAQHMSSGGVTWAFWLGLALLTFMLSWSDVLFSRYLLSGYPDQRLLTDLVIEKLNANDLIVARSELAAVATMCIMVASIASACYSVLFLKANRSR